MITGTPSELDSRVGHIRLRDQACILLTNTMVAGRSGSELYLAEVATGLIERGYKPVVYSSRLGPLAQELARRAIPVLQDLKSVAVKPDLIHGQHHLETMAALSRFPGTPAVFFCHGWLPWEEMPPIHPRILHYVTVSDALRDRLMFEFGIQSDKVTTILNSVDLGAFPSRPPLPLRPKRALVFNNQVTEGNIAGVVREACRQEGVELDLMGYESGNAAVDPGARLGAYDIVFAVGRSALEGLAVGAAVICCGVEGAGPMVTTGNLEWMRRNNFGIRVQTLPLNAETLSAEIRRYDAQDAQAVSAAVRARAGRPAMLDRIEQVYARTLTSFAQAPDVDLAAESAAMSAYLGRISEPVYRGLAATSEVHQAAAALRVELAGAQESASALRRELDAVRKKAEQLSSELALIKGTLTWKLRQRILAIEPLRKLYAWLRGAA